jgi:hypothetical protein
VPVSSAREPLCTTGGNTVVFVAEATKGANEEPEWDAVLKENLKLLSVPDAARAFEALKRFSRMRDGHLGKMEAVQRHIVAYGPPISSQPYRAGPSARDAICTKN